MPIRSKGGSYLASKKLDSLGYYIFTIKKHYGMKTQKLAYASIKVNINRLYFKYVNNVFY
jgi:hypothetical protein